MLGTAPHITYGQLALWLQLSAMTLGTSCAGLKRCVEMVRDLCH